MKKFLKTKSKQRIGKGLVKKLFNFKSKVIVWSSGNYGEGIDKGAWRFARVPEKISEKIREMQKGRLKRGWGAVYVKAKIRKSEWDTSIFPDRRSATYLLPLKKEIRYQENLYDGIDIKVSIEVWF